MAIRQGKLNAYIRALVHRRDGFTAGLAIPRTVTLQLYEALANNPLTARELAKTTGAHPDAVVKWLGIQTRRCHLQYDAARQQYWMTEQQALILDRERGLCFPGNVLRTRRHVGPIAR